MTEETVGSYDILQPAGRSRSREPKFAWKAIAECHDSGSDLG